MPTDSVSSLGSSADHDQDEVTDDIVLEPYDGPNGVYTVVGNKTFAVHTPGKATPTLVPHLTQ